MTTLDQVLLAGEFSRHSADQQKSAIHVNVSVVE